MPLPQFNKKKKIRCRRLGQSSGRQLLTVSQHKRGDDESEPEGSITDIPSKPELEIHPSPSGKER